MNTSDLSAGSGAPESSRHEKVALDFGSFEFRKFAARLDRQLAELVQRWQPYAAPNAGQDRWGRQR